MLPLDIKCCVFKSQIYLSLGYLSAMATIAVCCVAVTVAKTVNHRKKMLYFYNGHKSSKEKKAKVSVLLGGEAQNLKVHVTDMIRNDFALVSSVCDHSCD